MYSCDPNPTSTNLTMLLTCTCTCSVEDRPSNLHSSFDSLIQHKYRATCPEALVESTNHREHAYAVVKKLVGHDVGARV